MNAACRGFIVAVALGANMAVAQSDDWLKEERAKEQFLCEWREASQLDESLAQPLEFCVRADLPIGTALVEQDGWWGKLLDRNYGRSSRELKQQFEADWLGSPQRAAILRAKADANRTAAHRREDAFASKVGTMPPFELCVALHSHHYQSARDELKKRNLFTDEEWRLITAGQIQIGMKEAALLCSWGAPDHVNSTVTARTDHQQYIYDQGRYVYVENGVVTSIQETR